MKNKSILLNIMLWCELIISARVLVFTLPVLISNYFSKELSLVSLDGRTILILTLIALYYFVTALASIARLKGWRWFHHLGLLVTLALNFSLIKKVVEIHGSVSLVYFTPIIISIMLSLFVVLFREQKQAVAH